MALDFLFARQLAEVLSGVDVHLVPYTRESIQQLAVSMFRDYVPSAQDEWNLMRRLRGLAPDCIWILNSVLDLQCALFCHSETRQLLVIGPCLAGNHTEKEATLFLRRHGLSEPRIRSLLAFCQQQPLVPYERLHALAQLLAQQMTGNVTPLPYRHIDYLLQSDDLQQIPDPNTVEELAHVRRVEERYAASAAMTEAVKQGNLSLAYRLVQRMQPMQNELVRTHYTLRNAQNLCIILNTQLRHAMEETGVPPYRLDQLSGGIARQIEKFKSTAAINAYFTEIITQYCALAQEKTQQGLSPFGRQAVTYIKSHLSDNLTVKDAAKALLMNPDYLSARFHREVGVSFITYVNRERVSQAAALLRRTDLQIQQIASAVGYNNTSYFARQFVKFKGMPPREYRAAGKQTAWSRRCPTQITREETADG